MPKRLPVLDGVRGVAILLVLIGHFIGTAWSVSSLGVTGVQLFFVLSGFLITRILVRDLEAGRFSLRTFYYRRFFRTMPAFWVFLCATAAIAVATKSQVYGELLSAFFYVANYHVVHWAVGHTWSLSVEEQFYLLWPLCFAVLGPRRSQVWLIATIVLAPIIRAHLDATDPVLPQFGFFANADALALGCLLAVTREGFSSSRFWRSITHKWALPIYTALALAAAWSFAASTRTRSISRSVLVLSFALAIETALRNRPKFLTMAPLTAIGRVSYSLYLWQQIGTGAQPLHMATLPGFALSMLCGIGSYFLIERPFLMIRDRSHRTETVPVPEPSAAQAGYTCPGVNAA